jgi:SAM-dependent methyltransferase
MSYKYYDDHASEYYESSFSADMSKTMQIFLKYLPKGSSILDAGCGTGRDTKIFLNLGYQVSAFDASIEMVKLSSKYTGIQVRLLKFEDLDYNKQFDGIWACASLLHVDRNKLEHVFTMLKSSLNNKGVLYCSFKSREVDFTKDGRNFTCFTLEKLIQFIEKLNQFKVLEVWESSDVRTNRESEYWTNIIIQKI